MVLRLIASLSIYIHVCRTGDLTVWRLSFFSFSREFRALYYLLVPSVDDLYEQFGHRPSYRKRRGGSGSKMLDTHSDGI